MRKGLLTLTGLALLTILATSGVKKVDHSSGITGSSTGCSCHGGSAGTVTLKGLPTHVKAGATYPFTLVYAIGTNMSYWGLDIKVTAGTLTPGTGMRAGSTTEVTHSSPLTSPATSTYTYTGMSWNTTGLTVGTVVKFTFATLGSTSASSSGAGKDAKGTFSDTIATTNAPVEFETVNAAWLGDNKVNVSWKTATETNSDHFEVERSFNGETYSTISTIKAAGVSDHLISYSVNDLITTGNSSAYYRIKDVDKDGAVTYSDIKEVNVKPTKSFVKTLFPNPVTGGQAINLQYVALENGKVNIELYNCLGKKMNSLTTDAVYGENNIKFNTGRFVSPGIYYIVVNNGIEKIAQLPVSVQ